MDHMCTISFHMYSFPASPWAIHLLYNDRSQAMLTWLSPRLCCDLHDISFNHRRCSSTQQPQPNECIFTVSLLCRLARPSKLVQNESIGDDRRVPGTTFKRKNSLGFNKGSESSQLAQSVEHHPPSPVPPPHTHTPHPHINTAPVSAQRWWTVCNFLIKSLLKRLGAAETVTVNGCWAINPSELYRPGPYYTEITATRAATATDTQTLDIYIYIFTNVYKYVCIYKYILYKYNKYIQDLLTPISVNKQRI